MIIEIKGDVRDTDCKLIAHGVNCQGVMGSGVARALFEKWPRVKDMYHDYFNEFNAGPNGENFLGSIDVFPVGDNGMYVANCFTQQYYGGGDRQYVDYQAVLECMEGLRQVCDDFGLTEIAMPKIGCGLAGGDWNMVKSILDYVFEDITVKVYVL